MIWNVGFWSNTDLKSGDCFATGDYTAAFDEAMARLYEGMVLLPLGHSERVEDLKHPGATVPLFIEVKSLNVPCLIDRNLPSDASHIWKAIDAPLVPAVTSFTSGGSSIGTRWDIGISTSLKC